jgi:GNAT superfamily N-acetyltransferase
VAGAFGVRYYATLYGEKRLIGPVERIDAPAALDVRPAAEGELVHLTGLLGPKERRLSLRARAEGSECLIAWHEGAVAGYSWINRRVIVFVGDRLASLPPEGAYTFFSFVWPGYRGQKVFQVLTEAVYRRLQQEGFQFCCNMVDRDNAGSIGARAKFGVVYRPAPVLKLPGLRPFVLGRGLPFGLARSPDSEEPPVES